MSLKMMAAFAARRAEAQKFEQPPQRFAPAGWEDFAQSSYSEDLVQVIADVPLGSALSHLNEQWVMPDQTIVVTWNPCPEYHEDLWGLGAAGLVIGDDQHEIEVARSAIYNGKRYRSPAREASVLTAGERRILRLVASGYSTKEIANALYCREQTVMNYLSRIYLALQVNNRTEAALYYWGIQKAPAFG